MKTVAILFARADSIYKTMEDCDVWDIERDARKFAGGMPVVAHPPCRSWGVLKHFAKPRPDEKALAPWAIEQIRKNGGVLEHPAGSALWPHLSLPLPGQRDKWGGWTIQAPQWWWGHRADKETRFYICGCEPKNAPQIPISLGNAPCLLTHNAATAKKRKAGLFVRPECSRYEREATPPALAAWLVELARLTNKP